MKEEKYMPQSIELDELKLDSDQRKLAEAVHKAIYPEKQPEGAKQITSFRDRLTRVEEYLNPLRLDLYRDVKGTLDDIFLNSQKEPKPF